jgi:cobalamin biosynthesis Mg chelatase CobN
MTTSTKALEDPWHRLVRATDRRELQALCYTCGYAADPIVRAWFALARRAEIGRVVDLSGWPVLSTRDTFALIRGWGKTLRDLGEPVADLARLWESNARARLFSLATEPLRGPTDAYFASVKLWADGVHKATHVAVAVRSQAALRAVVLAGIERLGVSLQRRR